LRPCESYASGCARVGVTEGDYRTIIGYPQAVRIQAEFRSPWIPGVWHKWSCATAAPCL